MKPELELLLPHRPPIVFIDRLVRSDGNAGLAVATFPRDGYGVADGRVLEPALIEALAQTVAAMKATSTAGSAPSQGMLVAVNDFEFLSDATPELELELHVLSSRRLGPFVLIEGEVLQGGARVARGSLSFYADEGASADPGGPPAT